MLKLLQIDDYCGTDIFQSTCFWKLLLSSDRFKAILYILHLSSEQYVKRCEDGYNPIYKILPFFEFFLENAMKVSPIFFPKQVSPKQIFCMQTLQLMKAHVLLEVV